jgi:hypothetical protein
MVLVKTLQQGIVDSAARTAAAALRIRAQGMQESLAAKIRDQVRYPSFCV